MAKVDLRKVQREAKKIRKMHPNKGNAAVMKEAWSVARGGKLSGVRRSKKKKSKAKVGKARRSKKKKSKAKVGKARRRTVTAREIHEIKRVGAISYTGGKVRISGIGGIEKAKKELLHKLGEQAGWLEVAISQERTATGRKKLHKKLSEVRGEMRRIS
jgi:hypothetical protein